MSDDTTHEEGDLLQSTDQNEAAADAALDTDEVETSDGEPEQEGLDLEEEETPSKSEANKLKQIKAWQKKIDSGSADIDDLPKDVKWIKEYISPKHETDVSAVRRVIQEERNEAKFQDIRDGLEDHDLSQEQTAKLNARYKSLRAKGLSKLDAIEASMEIAQVNLGNQDKTERRKKMKIPKPGGKTASRDYATMLETLPFSEAEKLIPSKELDKLLRESVIPSHGD